MELTYDEMHAIRELLSHISCHHERESYFFDCCDAAEIINKIDKELEDEQ